MKKQRRIPGSILEIQLEDQSLSYAQVLKMGVVFFDLNAKDSFTDLNVILEKTCLIYYRDIRSYYYKREMESSWKSANNIRHN